MYARVGMKMERIPLLGLTLEELRSVAAEVELPTFAVRQMASWLYQKGVASIDEMTNISLAARKRLSERYEVGHDWAPGIPRATNSLGYP